MQEARFSTRPGVPVDFPFNGLTKCGSENREKDVHRQIGAINHYKDPHRRSLISWFVAISAFV